jgi:hypothetical protein
MQQMQKRNNKPISCLNLINLDLTLTLTLIILSFIPPPFILLTNFPNSFIPIQSIGNFIWNMLIPRTDERFSKLAEITLEDW